MLMDCRGSFFRDIPSKNIIVWQQFFPEYGCLIIAHKEVMALYGIVFLQVLGLDRHNLEMHYPGSTGHAYIGNPTDYQALALGLIEESNLPNVGKRFAEYLAKAQTMRDTQRTAAGGRQGNQHTPAFIYALRSQANECKCTCENCTCSKKLSVGGFTDNGFAYRW